MVDTPFLLRPLRSSIDVAKKRVNEAKIREEILKAQNKATPKPKPGLFERAIKASAGFVPDVIEDPVKSGGSKALKGLSTWGDQVAAAPALFTTRGKIGEQGQYETQRNLWGNPIANVQSHIDTQREMGETIAPGSIMDAIKAANRAGGAFNQDPDIPSGVKTAVGIGLDPLNALGAGALSKAPKIAAVGGAKGKIARAPLSILEGFDTSAQFARFTAGAAGGSQLAENYGVPGVGEGAEQFLGSMGGGIGGLLAGKRGGFLQTMKDVDPAIAKLQGREGKPAAIGFQIEWVHPEERIVHATPNVIPEGQIIPSEWGDHGPGHYASREHETTTISYAEGDKLHYKQDYWGNKPWPKPEDKGDTAAPQAYRYRVKRPAAMLIVDEPLTFDELQNIKRAAPDEFAEQWDYMMSIHMPNKGSTVLEILKSVVGRNAAVGEVLADAGFDGMAGTKNWTPEKGPEQLNFFRPNDILEVDLTPPTMDYDMKKAMAKGETPVFNPKPANITQFPNPFKVDSQGNKYSALEEAGIIAATPNHPLSAKADELLDLHHGGHLSESQFSIKWDMLVNKQTQSLTPSQQASYDYLIKLGYSHDVALADALNDYPPPVTTNTAGKTPKIEFQSKTDEILAGLAPTDKPQVKYDVDAYLKMLDSLTSKQATEFDKSIPVMGFKTDDEYMQALTDFVADIKGSKSAPLKTQLGNIGVFNENIVAKLTNQGYYPNAGGKPLDVTQYTMMPEKLKQIKEALELTDIAVKLTPQGYKQLDKVNALLKQLETQHGPDTYMKQWEKEYQSLTSKEASQYDEWLNSSEGKDFDGGLLEGIQYFKNGLNKTEFPLKSTKGTNYAYEPMTGQLMIEGADEPIFLINKDVDTGNYVWTDVSTGELLENVSVSGLVDNIAYAKDIETPLSPLGQALKNALMKDSADMKAKLDPELAKEVEEKGHVSYYDGEIMDFTSGLAHSLLTANMKKYHAALDWGQYEGKLDEYGEQQLNDLWKILDGSPQGQATKSPNLNADILKAVNKHGYYPNKGGNPFDQWSILSEQELEDAIAVLNTLDPISSTADHQLYVAEKHLKKLQESKSTIKPLPKVGGVIKNAPQPVNPDEIAGINQPKTKTVEEFVQFTEEQLGKPYEFKNYAPQGQPGAPKAGVANVGQVVKEQLESKGMKPAIDPNPMTQAQKEAASYKYPKEAGPEDVKALKDNEMVKDLQSLTPAQKAKYDKLKAGELGPNFKNAPHSVLLKEAKKNVGVFGNVSGGALPEVLVTPKEIQVGLTKGEKVANAITKVKKFILGHGVSNNEIATPIAREYVRINNVLKTQAINIGKLAERAEKMLGIESLDDIVDLENLTKAKRDVVDSLQRSMDAYHETLKQFDTEFDDIQDFVAKIREEEGFERKDFSDIVTEYGNAIANKVSDKWLQGEIKKVGDAIDLSAEAGKKIPTSTVRVAKDIKLPRAVGDVLEEVVNKVHPPKSPAYAELFTAINNQLRGMWAAGDASNQMIQMLPTWADNPRVAFQSTKIGLKALADPTVMADFILRHDEVRYGTRKPSVTEYIRNGLHIAHSLGEGTDLGGISGRIQNIKGYGAFLKKSNTLFTETGNANRIALADALWDQYEAGGVAMLTGVPLKGGTKVGAKEGMTRAQVLESISEAVNRATGYSHRGFGGAYGSALFFAPRFMQSQIETVVKAASLKNGLENQVARRQMLKLITIGAAMTVAMNEINGEDTDFDPRSSNFLRIKNVGGADLSLFGPWDTLVRGVIRSVPHMTEDGEWTLGDPGYLLRSKLSPVLSSAMDWTTGENVIGEKSRTPEAMFKNTFLPFSGRDVDMPTLSDPAPWGDEGGVAFAAGLLGAKGSPLTGTEKLDNDLEAAGIKKSDPEYLIKRRDFLAANPDAIPESQSEDFKRAQEIQKNISERRKANDDAAAASTIGLTEFRENRKLLLTEQRNRLGEVLKDDIKKANNEQKNWLNTYFELFDDETNKDFITGEIDPEAFDTAVAEWTNKHGTAALEFVNKYMGAGLNPVERAYYNDMRKLEAAGYFDVPKYHKMQSGLTEDEIDSLARTVDSFRASNPDLQDQPWATTAKRILRDSLSAEEMLDIIRSRKEAFQNPEREALKAQFGKEVLWFNSRADWNSYTNYTPGSRRAGSRRSRRTTRTANVGGLLKKTIGA